MNNKDMNTSNKRKGDGNGNSVIDNHEYTKKSKATSSQSSNSTNITEDVKNSKREK